MTFEIAFTLVVLAGAVVLFVTEALRVDLVGMLVLSALLLGGILSPQDAFAGFANPATVTVAAMFILSSALLRTGVAETAGQAMARTVSTHPLLGLFSLMVGVGTISAFINNTAAVAILLPVVLDVANRAKVSPSKLLMPLSFASMFGGVCTLIGTSTNLLASEIAVSQGVERFGMFEFAPLGLVFFAFGVLYMMTVGRRVIPARRPPEDLTANFDLADYLIEVVVEPESKLVGARLDNLEMLRDLEVDVLEIRRGSGRRPLPAAQVELRAGDLLRVRTNLPSLRQLRETAGVDVAPEVRWRDEDLEDEEIALVEVVVPARSALIGRTLESARFRNRYGASVLAIRHHGELVHERLKTLRLDGGDTLLLEIQRDRLTQLRSSQEMLLVSEAQRAEMRPDKLLFAGVILAFVVLTATTGLLPIAVSSVVGCVAAVLTRCLTLEEAYEAIDWKIIFLLGGVLGLGSALDSTGGAGLLSGLVVDRLAFLGPIVVLSAFYLLTSVLTELMSNNATVVLLAPVAIATAAGLGVDPRPFLMAVTFAASASFMTPVGYQTNTLIYGPGRYRFADYLRVGLPLNLVFWILATLLIPRIWPLVPAG